MQQTVYLIVDGEIETVKVLRETTSQFMDDIVVVYHVEYKNGRRARCCENMHHKTQSDAWQDWANKHIEAIAILKARIRTDKETINRLNRELVGIE